MSNTHLTVNDDIGNLTDVDETGRAEHKILKRDGSGNLSPISVYKEHFFKHSQQDNYGGSVIPTITPGENGNNPEELTLSVPSDAESDIAIYLVISNVNGGNANHDLDLSSQYGNPDNNEAYNTHSESDTGSTYDLSNDDYAYYIDITSKVFNSISAGDVAGLLVTNQENETVKVVGTIVRYISNEGV